MSKSNVHLAAERLRTLIFQGELGAGTDHLETELATLLGMSRTPIREALVILEAQGLVDMRPRKGVRIRPISAQDVAEIYDVLTELESLAAAEAAAKGYGDADLRDLAQAIDDMDAALGRQDRLSWAEADGRFHAELVRLGGNGRVATIVAMMEDQVRRARLVTLHMRPLPQASNADHRVVLQAIRAQDAETARSEHHAHRSRAKGVLIGLLEANHLRVL